MVSNFEEQFTQSIHSPAPPTSNQKLQGPSIFALIIITILATIVFIETIVIAILSINYFDLANGTYVETEEVYEIDSETNTN